jgi:UDP-N-acetylglucosamine acyltransferase
MNHVHIAHDCQVGNQTIIAGYSGLAGHVQLGDWAIVGGQSGLLQFVRVGAHAMIGFQRPRLAGRAAVHDGRRPPAHGARLQRRGHAPARLLGERIAAVKQMHRLLYRDGLTFDDARARIGALAEATPEAADDVRLVDGFLAAATRGIAR